MSTASLMTEKLPLIKVVGVSASGKSTLVTALRAAGWNARPVSQEHSDVAELWKQFGFPRILIYLDNDLAGQQARRPDVSWGGDALAQERQRLSHAYENADLRLNTAQLTPEQVQQLVAAFLRANQIRCAATPLSPLPRTGGSTPAAPPSR
jgi:energy-coupling factor transporter ATP-binding protein EcfA2